MNQTLHFIHHTIQLIINIKNKYIIMNNLDYNEFLLQYLNLYFIFKINQYFHHHPFMVKINLN